MYARWFNPVAALFASSYASSERRRECDAASTSRWRPRAFLHFSEFSVPAFRFGADTPSASVDGDVGAFLGVCVTAHAELALRGSISTHAGPADLVSWTFTLLLAAD